MIYLDNDTTLQDLYIPRQSAAPVSGSTDWASRQYVQGLMNAETARTEATYAKKEELSAYTPTTGFTTINGQAITNGGDITIEGTAYQGGDNIQISGNTISVTGIPTEFKTINGSGITGEGNLVIEGKVYSAGTNIEITNENVINVTGITIPTKVSDLENDEGYLTSNDISGYSTTEQVESMVSAATAATTGWVESQNYLKEHQSLSAYSTTEQVEGMVSAATAATTGWVSDQHYLTEHQSLSAYSTTEQVEGMITAATATTTGWVESQNYLTEHQSLSAYTPTSGFSTINGSAITSGDALVLDTSATIELTQAEYDALPVKEEGTIYVITDAPSIDIDSLGSKKLEMLQTLPQPQPQGTPMKEITIDYQAIEDDGGDTLHVWLGVEEDQEEIEASPINLKIDGTISIDFLENTHPEFEGTYYNLGAYDILVNYLPTQNILKVIVPAEYYLGHQATDENDDPVDDSDYISIRSYNSYGDFMSEFRVDYGQMTQEELFLGVAINEYAYDFEVVGGQTILCSDYNNSQNNLTIDPTSDNYPDWTNFRDVFEFKYDSSTQIFCVRLMTALFDELFVSDLEYQPVDYSTFDFTSIYTLTNYEKVDSTLPPYAVDGDIINYKGDLFIYHTGSVTTAKIEKIDDNLHVFRYDNLTQDMDGKTLLDIWYGTYTPYDLVKYNASANTFEIYASNSSTLKLTITQNNTAEVNCRCAYSSGYYLYFIWSGNSLYIRKTTSQLVPKNLWSGFTTNGGWVLLNQPTGFINGAINDGSVQYGIPKWNRYGDVVGKQYDIYDKGIKLNTTGTSTTFVSRNTNGPSSLFAPTAGGTQGQVLLSGGANAEPTWNTWIKSVQITSAEYDALVQAGTTDQNTLYLICDE